MEESVGTSNYGNDKMRVLKKISTPFMTCKPTEAIILMNLYDPQRPTIKVFIQACKDYGIPYQVYGSKCDLVKDYKKKTRRMSRQMNEKVIPLSVKKGVGLEKVQEFILKKGKNRRIVILGIFNSGKTSLINFFCGTNHKVGDIPGTTLEFTETRYDENTVLIDSIGQLIDVNKPLMVSIDFNGLKDREDKINKVLEEEVDGLIETAKHCQNHIYQAIDIMKHAIDRKKKVVVVGAGASALVAKEMGGQGMETGVPIMVFTNELADSMPVSFSKGVAETEMGLSKYIVNAVCRGDVVIGISASGGTGFVYDVLRRSQKKKATTISITENIDTPLGKYSDLVIKSNAKPEGPSSSKIQTAHLAIGHALMLVLADERGISAERSVDYMLPEPIDNKKMGIK